MRAASAISPPMRRTADGDAGRRQGGGIGPQAGRRRLVVVGLHSLGRLDRAPGRGGVLAVRQGDRRVGQQPPGDVGLRHHQLRLVDRHRLGRHLHIGFLLPDEGDLAHRAQPHRRIDDPVRRRLRRALSAAASRPGLVRLLAGPLSGHDGAVAAIQKPASVGLLRHPDLCDQLGAVLVSRTDSRPRGAAGPRGNAGQAIGLRVAGGRIPRARRAMAALPRHLWRAGGADGAAGLFGSFDRRP